MLSFLFAIALDCGELCSPEALRQYTFLLAAGGFGVSDIEHGAFVVRESDGTLRLRKWPPGERTRVSYTGSKPTGVICIAHTHPGRDFHPSYHDSREAIRIGLPIVVVTPIALSVAWPDGTKTYVMDSGWTRSRSR